MDVEATHSHEVESLKRLLQESDKKIAISEEEITELKRKLVKLETTGNESELLNERLRQTERELTNIKKEAANYQNMLQQSQAQYMSLGKKYNKAKRLVRGFSNVKSTWYIVRNSIYNYYEKRPGIQCAC